MRKEKNLSSKEYIRSIAGVAKLSFTTAPFAISFKLFGILINAVLPIIITYFAALTTTQLAEAYTGAEGAGRLALILVVVTSLLGLLTTMWQSVDQYIQQLMRYKVEAKVSDIMYQHFLSLEFWRYDDKDTADLYDRAQRFSQFFAYVFDRLAGVLTHIVTVVFALVALLIFLPWIALFVLVAVVPGLFIQLKLSRAQIAHWNHTIDTRRSKTFIEWNLFQPNAIAELRLLGLVRRLLDVRQKLRDKDERDRLQYERNYIGKRLLADALEAFAELGSLIWVVLKIIAGQQPVGQFVYVQQLVSRAMSGANGFVRELSTIDEDLANLFDYEEFMRLPAGQGGGKALRRAPGVIAFHNVSFHYPGTKQKVLKNLTFDIKNGQHVAIVGENGAGKTTLIKLLTGLYAPSSGTVSLDDDSLQNINVSSWHKKLSVLQQDFERYLFTDIKHNVIYGDVNRPFHEKHFIGTLRQAEAEDFVAKLPYKSETIPSPWMESEEGGKGTALSGGQWQRLALGRNFYRDAPVIILDEPTSAIDALAESRIFRRLFSKNNPKTVITISHRLSTVERADLILVLENGKIVERGTHEELLKLRGKYYTMFESQLK